MFSYLCIFVIVVRVLFKNIRLTGYRIIAGQEEDGTVELGLYESIRIGFTGKEVELVAAVQVIMITRITICVCDVLAPMFDAVLQIFISDTNGHNNGDINDFVQAPVGAIFTAFIGILIGYADAPKNGTDTKYNNVIFYLTSDTKAPQNNGLGRGLIAPHSDAGLTNFIGCNNRRCVPRGGEPIATIIIGFLYCFNEYCNGFENDRSVVLTAIETTTMTIDTKFQGVLPALIAITEGFQNIFAITGVGRPYQEGGALCSFDLICSCSLIKPPLKFVIIDLNNYKMQVLKFYNMVLCRIRFNSTWF